MILQHRLQGQGQLNIVQENLTQKLRIKRNSILQGQIQGKGQWDSLQIKVTQKQRKLSHKERKINIPVQDQDQLQDHQGQPQGHHQGHCPDLIKEGSKQKVINQEWTNISIICVQSQGHHQGQIPDLLIKRPDMLNQRSISTNVIHRLVQNHSQDLVQGQGHTEQRQGQRKLKKITSSFTTFRLWYRLFGG